MEWNDKEFESPKDITAEEKKEVAEQVEFRQTQEGPAEPKLKQIRIATAKRKNKM